MVEVEPVHALVERMADVVSAMLGVAELCRDVDLIAGYSGFSQCKPHAHFIPVHLRGVDVAIANLERETDDISRLARVLRRRCTVRGDLQCTKTQLRDLSSVVEGDCRDHRLALPLQLRTSPFHLWALAPAPMSSAWQCPLHRRPYAHSMAARGCRANGIRLLRARRYATPCPRQVPLQIHRAMMWPSRSQSCCGNAVHVAFDPLDAGAIAPCSL